MYCHIFKTKIQTHTHESYMLWIKDFFLHPLYFIYNRTYIFYLIRNTSQFCNRYVTVAMISKQISQNAFEYKFKWLCHDLFIKESSWSQCISIFKSLTFYCMKGRYRFQ